MAKLLGLANETLFLTNLFIYTYKILLKILNRLFPPVINTDFFPRELFSPEPFEIPLYLILATVWVIIILSKSLNLFTLRTGPKRWIYFLVLLLAFFLNIGSYPMKNSAEFIKSPVDPMSSLIILIIYLIIILAIIAIVYHLKKLKIILFLLILAVLALFTVEPGFPSNPHDASFFLGPIFEISQGKTIFTTTSSQYGFLSVLILGALTNLRLFNPFYLPLLTWFLYIIEYFLCFYIIYKASRSIVFSLIGLFSILTINYFSLYHLANTLPQIGPLRWLPLILSLFLIQRFKTITNGKLILILSLLSLWNVEAGVALLLSYASTLLLLTITGYIKKKKLILSFILLFTDILISLTLLNFIHLVSGRQTIDFIAAFTRLREFAVAGVAMIPLPWRTHFWFVLLVYFATIIYVFRNTKQMVDDRGWKIDNEVRKSRIDKFNLLSSIFKSPPSIFYHPSSILLFSANLSLFASVYYIGRSHPHNLFHISIFFLLNTFLFFNEFLKNNPKKTLLTTIYLLLITFFIVYPAYNRKQALSTMILRNFVELKKADIFKPRLEKTVKQYYLTESFLIKKNLTDEEILILSVDETYLFYLVGKKNLLLDNPQSGMATASKADLKLALKRALEICPQKLAASCNLFGQCSEYPTLNYEAEAINIQKILLETLEKSCKVKYKPSQCSQKLCIATSKIIP
ncbi:hypothetical protein A3B40_05285 [Candidatus Roizmanbacteria bacterium RIFCSPLOWO2_01_FULL_37_16]|uniref:Uncharacterized protein n=1 Tax=Candidatus Roizmanbacteria bacterium RIFCSPLOWO2_01_FULL_37_16 TaxID=1802058 RepID=A0A1F7IMG7_9BACT|nr:MAG: hypothetical protein A2859_04165 [Candidatus Roizmanbacteria bacterium RIFCSPHIGHO2_01_FULL_37_16b]OGK44569.1 MAG: hypothetical protein A3B40_05285 [Candidatus Roizmanbacteria bacterium RIFCSPLOWO2_01_FULL_37_16]